MSVIPDFPNYVPDSDFLNQVNHYIRSCDYVRLKYIYLVASHELNTRDLWSYDSNLHVEERK